MRVIAGSARRLLLETPRGMNTRPTTDKYKETLFNILQPYISGCHFLDLFAGSGAIGIEALSRGAGSAVFVENNRAAAACIRRNLEHTHLEEKAVLLNQDVLASISRLEREKKVFDVIFMDPPYGKEWEKQVLLRLSHSPLAGEDTLFVVEADLETDFSWLPAAGFTETRRKEYKTNMHVFIKKGDKDDNE